MTEGSVVLPEGERVGLFHYRVTAEGWLHLLQQNVRLMSLLGFWADEEWATALFLLQGEQPLLLSTAVVQGRYQAASQYFPAAQWGERMARDLWGVEAWSALDDSPALDDGSWSLAAPLSARPLPVSEGTGQPLPRCRIAPFRTAIPGLLGVDYVLADGVMQQVEVQIAAGHRGVLSRLVGLTPQEAMPLVARISAGGFVAHPLAFVRALEQAENRQIDPRERDRRLILLEVERLGLHLFDLAQTAHQAGAGLMASLCDHAREHLAGLCTAHGLSRRLTDSIRLEGSSGVDAMIPFVQAVVQGVAPRLEQIRQLARLSDGRLKTIATVPTELAWDYALGGVIGRASGRYLDMRYMDEGVRTRAMGGAGRHEGDAWARSRQRLAESQEALKIMECIVADYGAESERQAIPRTDEGLGVAEGARGDVWYHVVLKEGRLASVQIRDPLVPLLAVLGSVLEGHEPEQLGLALVSLGLSPAGVAL
ncbi:hypothetical protein DTI93_08060 [Parasaccharibacter sp. TMW 2.1884]|uniref:NADH-quinone oxidoreductase subunit D-related protein n=1 Tax=Parasaccharibacter sp. TMW 2.1884 TaxID=2267834 RepID=UPI0013165F97|nr:hypothetical protein [Parasaccharibacter sp. TMW 2.1884]MCL1512335.1 hypothetical protein [Parasaccharibacter sp. TMW 2.1884]QGT75375.1 hypothetical protein GN304_06290 [Bombella sp. ESL0368]